jgi:hypothetical protein
MSNGRGMAWTGEGRLGMARLGSAVTARHVAAGQGGARHGLAWRGGRGMARQGTAWHGRAGRGGRG